MAITNDYIISASDVNTELDDLKNKTNQATSSAAGIMKLFTSLGQNTDGAPTNKCVQDAINAVSSAVLTKVFPVGAIYIFLLLSHLQLNI